ncbi:MAG: TetR/AcrR family transcriptional regulator [Anaerolineales bacterium]|nr:TetR/AcrR family transcriptional regulator [Anaerolineales bacterium]
MQELIPLDPMGADERKSERRDAAENREHILRIAESLFAEQGVASVNMADIAKAAGVGKGTLYRRFANKGELCLALMDDQFREFQDIMLDRFRQLTREQVPFLQQLEQFLEALVYFSEKHLSYLCEVQQLSLEQPQDFSRPHYWNEITIQGLLRQAAQAGEVAAECDIELAAVLLLAPLNAAVFRYMLGNRGFTLAQICTGMRTIIAGLAAARTGA